MNEKTVRSAPNVFNYSANTIKPLMRTGTDGSRGAADLCSVLRIIADRATSKAKTNAGNKPTPLQNIWQRIQVTFCRMMRFATNVTSIKENRSSSVIKRKRSWSPRNCFLIGPKCLYLLAQPTPSLAGLLYSSYIVSFSCMQFWRK